MNLTILFRLIEEQQEEDEYFKVNDFCLEASFIKVNIGSWLPGTGNIANGFVINYAELEGSKAPDELIKLRFEKCVKSLYNIENYVIDTRA